MSVCVTVYRLQFVVPEVEREQLGPGTQTQRWRPLQAVVAQIQVLQLAQGLRKTQTKRRTRRRYTQKNSKLYIFLKL